MGARWGRISKQGTERPKGKPLQWSMRGTIGALFSTGHGEVQTGRHLRATYKLKSVGLGHQLDARVRGGGDLDDCDDGGASHRC